MTKLVRNHSHWGAFLAEVEDGRVVGVRPFERDPDPSPLIEAIPAAVHSQTRIAQPMVREGWLKNGPGGGNGRGREPFVPVPWDRALDLVAGELSRVKRDYGHEAIMAGSQGWGSAGIFHEARGQLRRFMAIFGGFIDQTSNYSFGTALVFLPHVLGNAQPVTGPLTSWSSIARHSQLMVMFGGANPKNMQVTQGGCAAHANGQLAGATRQRRRRGRQRQPDPRGWPGRDQARMDRDQARHRHRDAAGADPYADRERPARPRFPRALLHRLRARARLCDGRERRPAEGRRLGGADHRHSRRHHPRAGAPHGGEPHHDQRVMVAAARRSRRAAVLGRYFARLVPRPDRLAGRRLRLRLRLGDRHRRTAAGVPRARHGGRGQSAQLAPFRRRASRSACCSPASPTTSTAAGSTYPDIKLVYWAGGNPFHHHQDTNQLRAAFRRPQTDRRARALVDGDRAPRRHRAAGDDDARAQRYRRRAARPLPDRDAEGHRAGRRSDATITRSSAALARRVGCEEAFTQGRDEMAWLRHLYDSWRDSVRTNQAAIPDFDRFWADGYFGNPASAPTNTCMFDNFRADPEPTS